MTQAWRTLLPLALACLFLACDQADTSALKGQRNTAITFYGLIQDDAGRALPGVEVTYQVEAYPKDWTFETRGRAYDISEVTAVSDDSGRFQFQATGSLLRFKSATAKGYRHLWERDTADSSSHTYAYQLIAWGDLWYKSDPDNPAVYVFVRDGVKEVSALPSRGGFDSGGGTVWRRNEPAWPKKPSLPDVFYKPPTTQLATTQAGS